MSSACWNLHDAAHDGNRLPAAAPPDWPALLPGQLRPLVVAPVRGETFRDGEMPAERTLGYDLQGRACYCVCRHVLSEVGLLDDERLQETPVLSECLSAWRLCDGGWLVHRSVRRYGVCGASGYEFFAVSETMPR